jgi:hypothetical protein
MPCLQEKARYGCSKGRKAKDGTIPAVYQLQETPKTDYKQRTGRNVRDSDGTLILTRGEPTGGTATTIKLAAANGKPCLVLDHCPGLASCLNSSEYCLLCCMTHLRSHYRPFWICP